jgi:hypothetical protein
MAVKWEVLQHHPPDQARTILAAALELVDDLGPPNDLREAFFGKAVDLLATRTAVPTAPVPMGAMGGLEALRIPRA